MLLAYVDESGDEQPLRTPEDPPVLIIAGVVVDHEHAKNLVWKYLQLKKRFNDSLRKKDVRLSDLVRSRSRAAGSVRTFVRRPGVTAAGPSVSSTPW